MIPSENSVVSAVFLFDGMKESVIARHLQKCRYEHYLPGEVIHSSKRRADGVGVIISGHARIVSGSGDTLLRVLKRGDIFGAASLFAMDDRNRTAVIASVRCDILLIPATVVTDIISSDPDASIRYISFLSDRINFLNSRISALAAGDSVAKVAGFILSLNANADGVCMINDSLTNVASRLNMGRASLYRTIDRFVADGLISRNKDSIVILDRDGLEDTLFKKGSR